MKKQIDENGIFWCNEKSCFFFNVMQKQISENWIIYLCPVQPLILISYGTKQIPNYRSQDVTQRSIVFLDKKSKELSKQSSNRIMRHYTVLHNTFTQVLWQRAEWFCPWKPSHFMGVNVRVHRVAVVSRIVTQWISGLKSPHHLMHMSL